MYALSNFYIGNQEYILRYQGGTHCIKEVNESDEPLKVVFSGSYEECLRWIEKAGAEYYESCF